MLKEPLAIPSLNATQSAELVSLQNLTFRWKAKLPAVLEIDNLSIARGQKVFIKGSSGSGKTTLLNLIAGVIVPERGKVTIADTVLSSLRGSQRDRFRADHIGFIFQMFNLIPYLSVLENVTLALTFSNKRQKRLSGNAKDEAERILSRLGLSQSLIGRGVSELSVGQQQRVAAARAMIGSPPLLIADEPTSALDADSRESFIKLLFEECDRAQATLLFVSHDSSLEQLFDQSIALKTLNKAAHT